MDLQVLIIADPPLALATVAGVSLLERLLRVLQRLGFREATIVSNNLEAIAAALEPRSWASAGITAKVQSDGQVVAPTLILSAAFYYDARLVRALAEANTTTLLVDSSPPVDVVALWSGIARQPVGYCAPAAFFANTGFVETLSARSVLEDLMQHASAVARLDAAQFPPYVASMRRDIRPLCFPAPAAVDREVADRLAVDAAQNGTLDIPAIVHAPIETFIVRQLCRTRVTPNQVTFVTFAVGLAVTALYATGGLWTGTLLALVVGILDGVDGKLARVKVETSELGQWEHHFDYAVELSWWAALAFHFRSYGLLLLLVAGDLHGRIAKRVVKNQVHRNLDDVSAFDRGVRLVAGRRNIYVWIMAIGLLLRIPRYAFAAICWWSVACAAIYCVRAVQIRADTTRR